MKLPESELKVMEIVWENEGVSAKEVSTIMVERFGWKKNTSYTVLSNLITKGVLRRENPGFYLYPLIARHETGIRETESLLARFYSGSVSALFSCLLQDKKLSEKELSELKKMIDEKGVDI